MDKSKARNIIIMSTCYIDWGGSEELWAASIPYLQKQGFNIIVYKRYINRSFHKFSDLAEQGVVLKDYRSSLSFPFRMLAKRLYLLRKAYAESKQMPPAKDPDKAFIRNLKRFRPVLVIISQAINFDGLFYAYQCLLMGIPYVIVSQKAVDFFWPDTHDRSFMISTYLKAKKCFFVSHHNQQLTEEQLGTRLLNSEVIANPVKTTRQVIPYPSTNSGYRLACVGRLFLLDKGQDMLIRILSKEKWKGRPITISFVGTGDDKEPLQAMASLLQVNKIQFTGYLQQVETIWNDHHALILPSRSEGLPIAVVEAMASGRTVIVTNAGGSAEFITDDVTGFVGKADLDMLEEAMERAWNKRDHWQNMGLEAAKYIKKRVPENPAYDFSNQIKKLAND
jgi:glycosyltransferase involved in cell wall biosynthesis